MRSVFAFMSATVLGCGGGGNGTGTSGAGGASTGSTGGGSDAGGGGAGTGGASASASTSGGTGGSAPVVTTYDVAPGILSNQVREGFCEPELYTKMVDGKPQYWLRDNVKGYSDPRPRSFYIDFGYVGSTLDFGPIVRGGVYEVRCLRYTGAWYEHFDSMESHVVWFRVPGPMMEAGQTPVPATFQIQDNFIVDQKTLLPTFAPIKGKVNLVYKWWEKDTLADIYGHGATHISPIGGPGEMDPARLGLTTSMAVSGDWLLTLGVNPPPADIDAMGEQGFQKLTDAQIDDAAAQQQHTALFFTDLVKTVVYGDPNTFWSGDLLDATLPRYHRLLSAMRAADPQRLLSHLDSSLIWSKGFPSPGDGNPDPGDPKYKDQLANAESHIRPAYRKFTNTDGKTASLRDVIDIYTVDAYPYYGWGPSDGTPDKSDRSWASYQLYSMVYDTLFIRKIVPATAKVLWFGWAQSDNDKQTRLYIQLPTGRAAYNVRHPTPAAWAQTVTMLGNIVGDGYHWWTEQALRGNDPTHLGTGDSEANQLIWEPSVPNAPAPWTWSNNPNGYGAYPRMHEYAFSYGELGLYQVKQVEDSLSAWTFASYTLPGTPGCTASGDATILDVAQNRLPIVLLLGAPGHRALFAVHPFGDYRTSYTLTVDVDGKPTPLTISGKWPSLVKLP